MSSQVLFDKYQFNAEEEKEKIVSFIQEWFSTNGPQAKAIIGISGGKDSSIAAALCKEALGKHRVVGVLLPDGKQPDIDDAIRLVKHLDISYTIINIAEVKTKAIQAVLNGSFYSGFEGISRTPQCVQNIPPRLRMTILYAIAQGISGGGRVINTCNASEDYVGYSTKFGDSAGDVAPLASYTVTEILAIGDVIDIPNELVHKTPSDGLCGLSDEENLGFSYEMLDKYIITGECDDLTVKNLIDRRHNENKHKLEPIPKVER